MLETLNQSMITTAETENEAQGIVEAAEAQLAAINLVKKLNQNPMMIEAALSILNACATEPQEESALFEALQSELAKKKALPVQPLSAILALLVREEAAEESVTVNGAPYEGTLRDAFEDESITDESEVLIYAQATEVGVLVAQQLAPEERARALFYDRVDLAPALKRTLEVCNVPQGRTTSELQEILDVDGFLRRDERTNIPTLYPSLFANLLKDAGCIRWDHAWITTDLGRSVLAN